MIRFRKFTLSNGLRVIHHEDRSTPLVCLNVLYNVGSRDEHPERTGFAHLFEHLMFGGSVNIPNYDEPLQRVGGENNAFTTNDITNYYLTVPSSNIETAFWLESDRMLGLAFSEKSLEVQRNVVIEEFKQRYLNQPYGDVWLLMKPLAYKVHPYQWDTIGKDISHIEKARMQDVRDFFNRFYCPNNAILVVSGHITAGETKKLSEKWFGPISSGPENKRNLPAEPEQVEKRILSVEKNVPFDSIYMAFHMSERNHPEYYAVDLVSDILSQGNSSRLFRSLVMEKKLFSEIHAYVEGDFDRGLFVVSGKLLKGVKMQDAEQSIWEELDRMKKEMVNDAELTKVKNKVESTLEFSEMSILNKAMNLAFSELFGDANLVNLEAEKYHAVTAGEMREQSEKVLAEKNCSVLYYLSNN
jgi:predicted Zn-dependent peptidase